MSEGTYFEAMRENLEEERERQRMRERVQSLSGMILKGGKQGGDAEKVLIREFGQRALGLIIELKREAKRRK